ncbi:MAG TPA: adenylate/guanylate cyclase domain-containing protein, partial [Rhodospirillales bacterium]
SSGVGIAYIGRRERQQKRFIRGAFKRYLSPSIVDQLVADPSRLNVGGERRELTFLFTDLAGFTSLTERTAPAVLMALLNEYLNEMCRILFKHGATMDKIVGDAVVGFFNAPLDQPDHRARAVATALEMDAFSRVFIERQKAKGLEIGVTRIGVHSGVATIGNFGGDAFFNYTAHGDMVNTAARLESVNKHLGTRVCISGVTAAACPSVAFRPVGTLVLKGKKEGIEVFEPLADGLKDAPLTAAYRRAFEMLKRKDPAAIDAFRELLHNAPDDGLARFHLTRLQKGESGVVIVMEEK